MTQHNDNFNGPSMQFVLSFELLCLLRWLAEHDTQKLRKIIEKAYASGLEQEIQNVAKADGSFHAEDMHDGIVEFFNTCEALLAQTISKNITQRAREQNLMPAVDQIDMHQCDNATIQGSLEKATAAIKENPNSSGRDLLFKELLKRWKPHPKQAVN